MLAEEGGGVMKRMFSSQELRELSVYIADRIAPEIIQSLRESIHGRKEIMMPEDVAKMFHTSTAAIYKRCQRNQMPWHKDAMGHYFFYKNEIHNSLIIDNQEEGHL